jgi:hypothetical protein
MAVHIIMDRSGDTKHEFDVKDRVSIEEAEARFKQLTGTGFMAVALSDDGKPGRQIKAFDETVNATMFIPQLQGG